jgi:hypothetical protein
MIERDTERVDDPGGRVGQHVVSAIDGRLLADEPVRGECAQERFHDHPLALLVCAMHVVRAWRKS